MMDELDIAELSTRPNLKWAHAAERDTIPAWVADMDFPPPQAVHEALAGADLCYPRWDHDVRENPLIGAYVERTHAKWGHRPDPDAIRLFTDMIQALEAILHVATEPGDAVAIHTPAYPPFLESLELMGRRIVPIPMTDTGTRWTFDIDRRALAGCRALILVNPHNPTGRVLTRDELSALAAVAETHDLLVIADEIHAELTYEQHRHLAFAPFAPTRTVTLSSASKAFNLAGLRCAIADVAAPGVRKALDGLPPHMLGQPGTPGVLGTVAAWEHGEPWLAEVRTLLARNRDLVSAAFPGQHPPEATYLAWLRIAERPDSGVRLYPGTAFGPGGAGFARLNFATSRPVLDEILRRLTTG